MSNKTNFEKVTEILEGDKNLSYKGYPDNQRFYVGVIGKYTEGTTGLFGQKYYRLRSHINYEAYYGIKIPAGDHIHHRNGDTLDDSPGNLQLMKSSHHTLEHKLINRHNKVLEFKCLSSEAQVATIRSWTIKSIGNNVTVRGCGKTLVKREKDLDNYGGTE